MTQKRAAAGGSGVVSYLNRIVLTDFCNECASDVSAYRYWIILTVSTIALLSFSISYQRGWVRVHMSQLRR